MDLVLVVDQFVAGVDSLGEVFLAEVVESDVSVLSSVVQIGPSGDDTDRLILDLL